jgi:plastocyanin
MNRLLLLPALVFALASPAAALAAPSNPVATTNVVNISVPKGSLHFDTKTLVAKPGFVRINFTNNSTAPHNVSLEHNGEFEYGSTLTIGKGITTTFLTLAKGTYHVYSSVGTDEDKGMAATLIIK